jgi:hypothetical protein
MVYKTMHIRSSAISKPFLSNDPKARKSFTHPLHFSMILARTVPAKLYVRIFRVLSVKYTKPVLKSFLFQKYAKGVISPKHQD